METSPIRLLQRDFNNPLKDNKPSLNCFQSRLSRMLQQLEINKYKNPGDTINYKTIW